jgi:hypothetical protein
MSVPVLKNQRLNPSPFLILKNDYGRVIHADADALPKRRRGGGVGNVIHPKKQQKPLNQPYRRKERGLAG